ncbi:MAG TPA: AAA domain-containing protein, partial [Planctomycetaceae bacterium]|nr:AAA domain-containing protein [Planctomycetaceae bacterium]
MNQHFQRLLQCLDHEAAAETSSLVGMSLRSTGAAAEQSGCSLVGLAIRDETVGFGGRVVVTLGKRDRRLELPWTRLNVGSPVMLSEETETAEAMCRGIVTQRDRETVTVAVAEAPEPVGERPLFRLDLSSDEISRQRQREALRKAIAAERGPLAILKRCLLGEELAVFGTAKAWTPLSPLDDSQRDAVSHALAAESVAIIHGPPGTGKTTTVVELIRQAVRRGERVLACAPSNLAVDNLLERLLAGGERAIRLGHPARVLPELREHTLDVLVETHPDLKLAREWTKEAWALRREASKYKRTAPPPGERRNLRAEAKQLLDDVRRLESQLVAHLLDSATVVCATLTGLNAELLGERVFDLVVIDEAAQATEPTCWVPLLRARRLVLAGDHCQLPPTVLSHEARKENFHISLMERLHALCGATISRRLITQYRMHEQIMRFSSDTFYESSLIAAEAARQHRLTDLPQVTPSSLTQAVLKFYDTAGSSCDEQTEVEGSSRENPGEAAFVAQHVAALVTAGVATTEIAVITPYAAQARRLRQLIPDTTVEVDTVDGFQGREKEAVVISLVRSNPQGELGFLADTRRMNVALTRARRSLTVFGDSSTLANHEFYVRLLEYFEHQEAYGTVW